MAGSFQNGGNNMEENMDCGGFFDQFDDLLDFPMNDDGDIAASSLLLPGKLDAFPSIWPAGSDSVFSNTNSDLSAQLSVPYEDIVQLEWLSNFVEDSFSGGGSLTMNNDCTKQENSNSNSNSNLNSNSNNEEPFYTQFHTTSPVSVLESSSSSYGEKPGASGLIPIPVPSCRKGKARSKRARPATFNPRSAMNLISPTVSSVAENVPPSFSPKALSNSENYAESRPAVIKIPKQCPENDEPKKKKKMKLKIVHGSGQAGDDGPSGQAVRKCLHCEITKTPQWRAGPLGPKTLCNACGVRYKSGRLFPEYRPAASPTFIPSVHSNSHKKVLEMRSKPGLASSDGGPPELIPNPAVRSEYM